MTLVVRKKFANAPIQSAANNTHIWVPMTTTDPVSGDPTLLFDADGGLVLTLLPMA